MGSVADRFRARQVTGKLPAPAYRKAARHAGHNPPGIAAITKIAAEREALKGVYLGNCNVTACQSPGAVWWNTAMRKFYCRSCAKEINRPGWPLGADTPTLCFDRGIYVDDWTETLGEGV
jgi:hypothetical protein